MEAELETKIIDNDFREPDDEIWNENVFCEDREEMSLNNKEKLVFNVIDNIYGLVSLGMNFSMKVMGHDQLVNRFCYKKDDNDLYKNSDIVGSVVCGSYSFTLFPRGMINYHKYNIVLFKLTTIALMLTKGSFPIDYIDEISNRLKDEGSSRIFNIVRTSGEIQTCTVTRRSSIVYKTSSKKPTSKRWTIDVNFNDHPKMTPDEIEESEKGIIDGNGGLLNKGVELGEFMSLNDINEITLNITKLKLDIINSFMDMDFSQYDSDDSDEGDKVMEKELNKTYTKPTPIFTNESGVVDEELNTNINYIHEVCKNYFLNRLDKYIVCVKHSLSHHNIKIRII
jgi:hypothetical protein